MIAGLEEPDSGRILFDARDVTLDPPNKRGIGMVFQNYALFPHLSVAQNVAFGLEVRKESSSEVKRRTARLWNRCSWRSWVLHVSISFPADNNSVSHWLALW